VAKRKKSSSVLLQEAALIMGVPDFRDSVDKDELPINFILKKGRDRAEAKARKRPRPAATKRLAKKKKK
jgi:hypothetical protein